MNKKYITGFTCSAFDLLHPGHILMLKDAKSICKRLVVGLHVDPSIEREWKNKPVQTVKERLIMLNAIKFIDKIYVYNTENELIELIKLIKPNIRILGSDYISKFDEIVGAKLTPIHFHKREHTWSSSELRQRINNKC